MWTSEKTMVVGPWLASCTPSGVGIPIGAETLLQNLSLQETINGVIVLIKGAPWVGNGIESSC